MTDCDRLIWAAAYAVAFESEVRLLRHGDVVASDDLAVLASDRATESLRALHDAYAGGKLTRLASSAYEEFEGGDTK